MPCCGGGRRAAGTPSPARGSSSRVGAARGEPVRRGPWAYFQYVGTRGIRVRAPASGITYRFDTPGKVLLVDPRDRRALAGVPDLRQVARG